MRQSFDPQQIEFELPETRDKASAEATGDPFAQILHFQYRRIFVSRALSSVANIYQERKVKSNFKNVVFVATVTFLVACGGGGNGASNVPLRPAPTPPPESGVVGDGRLDELAEWARASQGVPAVAVVLVANGQVAEIAAVGDRSATESVAVSIDDKWHLGSLTKSMTATLAGVLVDQSVISWDTTPLDIWPELSAMIHPSFRDITMRQLLSHSSGMRRSDVTPFEFDQSAPGSAMERRRRYAAVLLAEPPIGPAGLDSYSNGGYIVAGAMMETIMSTPWEELLTQQVFGPLGMIDSAFGAPGSPDVTDQPWGHWDRSTHFEPVPPGPDADNPDTMGPAGTVHTTLDDYGRFMLAHIAGARGIPGLLTESTFEVMHSPVAGGSALGWGVIPYEPWARGPVLAHAGSNLRWFAVVRMAPTLDAGLMIVVNAGDGRAEATIDLLDDLIFERFEASQ